MTNLSPTLPAAPPKLVFKRQLTPTAIFDSKLIVPTKVISKSNVAEFTAEMKELLKK